MKTYSRRGIFHDANIDVVFCCGTSSLSVFVRKCKVVSEDVVRCWQQTVKMFVLYNRNQCVEYFFLTRIAPLALL